MKHFLSLAVLTLVSVSLAHAADTGQPITPKAQFAADSKAASVRYEDDKKLCNDEKNSAARLQCRRDAKAEYDKALSEARARMAAATQTGSAAPAAPVAAPVPACLDCGKVTDVAPVQKSGDAGALGVLAGGAAGALLGNQIGSGSGKNLATIAGAVGGAYAGKMIEEKVKTRTVWTVGVEFGDGSKGRYEFDQDPGFKAGDAVKKSGETVILLGR